jgi:predicted MFS family arabinose efflux permease
VSISALVARRVRPDERGRAFATVGAAVQAGTGTGTVAAAPLVAAAGAGHAMAGAGGLAALIAAVTAVWTWLVQSREEERARRDSNP